MDLRIHFIQDDWENSLRIECPLCGTGPGVPCINGVHLLESLHMERLRSPLRFIHVWDPSAIDPSHEIFLKQRGKWRQFAISQGPIVSWSILTYPHLIKDQFLIEDLESTLLGEELKGQSLLIFSMCPYDEVERILKDASNLLPPSI